MDFPKSKISRPLDTAGERSSRKSWAPRLSSSLSLKLGVLVGVFVALPVLLYNQFENADREMRELVTSGIYHQNWLIGQALKPALDATTRPSSALDDQLAKYSTDGTTLRLMFRPAQGRSQSDFLFVASAPPLPSSQFDAELDRLNRDGVLQHLTPTCTWLTSAEMRKDLPGGYAEILTSMIPIQTRAGCWVLVASHGTSDFLNTRIGKPYWQQPEIHLALLIYLAMAAVMMLIAWSVWLHIRRFRRTARAARRGRIIEHAFSAQNRIPELASAAADFDQLVFDLHDVARNVRLTAEENAHSFKGPVATIEASLAPLQRIAPPGDKRAERALALIASSLNRLKMLVESAQRVDNVTADLIDAPRVNMNMSEIVGDVVAEFRELCIARRVDLKLSIAEDIFVTASHGALDIVTENILQNALSFSPRGGTIQVELLREGGNATLRISDQGPGFDPSVLHRIFDRNFCARPGRDPESLPGGHAGLGLWIVKRHVENIGGSVAAGNLGAGGASVTVILPMQRRPVSTIVHHLAAAASR